MKTVSIGLVRVGGYRRRVRWTVKRLRTFTRMRTSASGKICSVYWVEHQPFIPTPFAPQSLGECGGGDKGGIHKCYCPCSLDPVGQCEPQSHTIDQRLLCDLLPDQQQHQTESHLEEIQYRPVQSHHDTIRADERRVKGVYPCQSWFQGEGTDQVGSHGYEDGDGYGDLHPDETHGFFKLFLGDETFGGVVSTMMPTGGWGVVARHDVDYEAVDTQVRYDKVERKMQSSSWWTLEKATSGKRFTSFQWWRHHRGVAETDFCQDASGESTLKSRPSCPEPVQDLITPQTVARYRWLRPESQRTSGSEVTIPTMA